jgi:CDP-6-deoxy-D-xylo-4-hexulose-3-dehydrase
MVSKYTRVPYGLSVHGKEEINAVVKVLKKSTQMGSNVRTFEKKISKLFNKKYGLMVNSGSSAIMLAIESLNLPPNSEVITPALTFSTTVSYLIKNKLKPVFIDVKKNTYCIDAHEVLKKINNKTKAIIAPHLMGNLVDWKKIKKGLKGRDIILIEDSADTIGSTINGVSPGSYTDISITSFYGSHIINCAGNGGMVCFKNKKLYEKSKLLRSWGRSSSLYDENSEKIENRFNIKIDGIDYDKKFVFEEIGHNLEPSELGAAFGLEQYKKLNKFLIKRKNIFDTHYEYFSKFFSFFDLPSQTPNSSTPWLAFPLIIKQNCPFKRKDLQIFLEKKNIQTRVVFTGNILRQPGFKFLNNYKKPFIEADRVMKFGFLIGCHQGMNKNMLRHLYRSFDIYLKRYI